MLLQDVEHKIKQVLSSTQQFVINNINIPQIREAIFTEELVQSLSLLNASVKKSKNTNNPLQNFKEYFKSICQQRWERIKSTELSYFNDSESIANSLFWEMAILLFEPKTLGELFSILMPGLEVLTFEVVKNKPEVALSYSNIKVVFHIKNMTEELYDPINKITNLDQFAVTDEVLFDLRNIAHWPIKEQMLFYNAIKLKHPTLEQEIYKHNHDFRALKSNINIINKKGLTLSFLIPEVVQRLKEGGERVTGNTIASEEAHYAAQDFITFVDSFFEYFENENSLIHANEKDFLNKLKKIKNHLEQGKCVEEAASALECFLFNFSQNPLLIKNLGLSEKALVEIKNKYSFFKSEILLNLDKDKEYKNMIFPCDLLEMAFNSLHLRNKDDYAAVLTVLPTNYYKFFFESAKKYNKIEEVLSAYSDLLRFNFLNEEQEECFSNLISNYLLDAIVDRDQFKHFLNMFGRKFKAKFIKSAGIERLKKFLIDNDDLKFVLNSVDNSLKIKIIKDLDKKFLIQLMLNQKDWRYIFNETFNGFKEAFFAKIGWNFVLDSIKDDFHELWDCLDYVVKVKFIEGVSGEYRKFFLNHKVIGDIFRRSESYLSKRIIDCFSREDWQKIAGEKKNLFSLSICLNSELKGYFLNKLGLDYLVLIDISANEFNILFEKISNQLINNYLQNSRKENIDNLVSNREHFCMCLKQIDDACKPYFWDKVDSELLIKTINNGEHFVYYLKNLSQNDCTILVKQLGWQHIAMLMDSFEILESTLSHFNLQEKLAFIDHFSKINLSLIIDATQKLDKLLDLFPKQTWLHVIKYISIDTLTSLESGIHQLETEKNILIFSEIKNKIFKAQLSCFKKDCSFFEIKTHVVSMIKEYLTGKILPSSCAYSLTKHFNKEYYRVSNLYKKFQNLEVEKFSPDNVGKILIEFISMLHDLNIKLYHGKKLFCIVQTLGEQLNIPFNYCYDTSLGMYYLSVCNLKPTHTLEARVHPKLTYNAENPSISI